DPDGIIGGTRSGLQRPEAARTIRPRAEAIARVMAEAAPEDTVLIAGKGHEAEQITAAGSQPYSDRETVARIQAGGAP
ncbi:MAG: UDP-N-acetylmuramoyl-L-alanyl-D-glutamate--2,6-diaminopimelate ligase, partial [Ectothiorhodospiraceae bacterium]